MQKDTNTTISQEDEYCQSTLIYYEDNEFSINYTFIDRAWESTITISQLFFIWVGPAFCSLCIIEALVRAVEARKAALDNRALDEFEKSNISNPEYREMFTKVYDKLRYQTLMTVTSDGEA